MAHVGDEIPGTARKKHRHDLHQEDHGPRLAAGTTRTIQVLLGLWIALTLVLVLYALVDGSKAGPIDATRQPNVPAATSASP